MFFFFFLVLGVRLDFFFCVLGVRLDLRMWGLPFPLGGDLLVRTTRIEHKCRKTLKRIKKKEKKKKKTKLPQKLRKKHPWREKKAQN